ncbi:hypothetical protein B0H14DRAFT_2648198 [Mycena olivaceomarginata]|nr:hypothetical protein B0H14DRAFT_2648198 [Mycena olivaceomarginata]
MFVATVPRQLLEHDNSEDTPVVVFARAFWDSWPLRIERRILHVLARLGVLFQARGGHLEAEGERSFIETARRLDGLFVVEAHEAPLVPLLHLGGCVHPKHSPSTGGSAYSVATTLSPLKIRRKSGMNPNPPSPRLVAAANTHHALSYIIFADFARSSGAQAAEERISSLSSTTSSSPNFNPGTVRHSTALEETQKQNFTPESVYTMAAEMWSIPEPAAQHLLKLSDREINSEGILRWEREDIRRQNAVHGFEQQE